MCIFLKNIHKPRNYISKKYRHCSHVLTFKVDTKKIVEG